MSSSTLAMAQAKSTPIKQITPAGVKESPGNWKHPRLSEITRRQNKTIFSEKNIRQIIYNALALVGVVSLRQVVLPLVPAVLFGPTLRKYNGWLTFALVLIPLINIGFALLPLFRAKDDLRDIPLTPAQRKLLGLPPSTRPETPNSVYSTPPRYSRTPSLAGSPVSIKSYTSSPLSNIASPSPYSASNLSPSKFNTSQYSPSAVSPLLHKAFAGGVQRPTYGSPSPIGGKRGGGVGLPRTSSYGSPSPLGASTSAYRYNASITSSVCDDEFATPGTPTTPTTPSTPTPTTGKRSSVSLNSKWLYEKGRRNSSSSWLHQNLS